MSGKRAVELGKRRKSVPVADMGGPDQSIEIEQAAEPGAVAEFGHGDAAMRVNARGCRTVRHAGIKMLERRFRVAGPKPHHGELLVRQRVAGIEGKGTLKGIRRVSVPPHGNQKTTQVEEKPVVARVVLNSVLQSNQGFVVALEAVQDETEIVMNLGMPRRDLKGVTQPAFSLRGIAALKAQHTQETQRVDIGRVTGERLPVQRLGIGQPARLMVGHGGRQIGGGQGRGGHRGAILYTGVGGVVMVPSPSD